LSFFSFVFINYTYHAGQSRLIKTNKTERLIASFEVKQQGYRHFLNTIVR